ncbi:MAG: hypothetical protein A2X35_01035 [Elusimicrobia bacterium GWA2_61_42]|nr:MAG: hypothetical protein A2X35_01035 [Elusimicrobia bacterium GWA2_61_42]OGR75202.1 MAG: hypothetical protein A2X38_04750 [Elusimicrobia bacterium GWC2_61_25]
MWHDKKVSLVFPTYNEKDSIRAAIIDFQSAGYIDEVIVVNNNAAAGTDEEVRTTSASLVHEPRQGFGFSIQKGLREATGDLIIVAEPDGTFAGKDILKLLSYSDDFDMVLGTRTTRELIWDGAYMGWLLRMGNYAVAKMLEVLFNTAYLSDVGCTMRLISRKGLGLIADKFQVTGSCFNPEMVMLASLNGVSFIEIPVNYMKRVGRSMGTKNLFNAVLLGFGMIWLIISYRVKSWIKG